MARRQPKNLGRGAPIDVRFEFDRGHQAYRAGRYKEAEAAYKKVLKADSKNAEAQHLVGSCLYAQGRAAEAQGFALRAAKADPKNARYRVTLGLVMVGAGQPRVALDCFTKAWELDPSNLDAALHIGYAHEALEDFESALEAYGRAEAAFPDNPRVQTSKGNALFHLRRLEESEALFCELIKTNPGDAAIWNGWASALSELDRNEEAADAYRKAAELLPGVSHPWFNLGNVLSELGRFDEASEAFESALQIEPENARVRVAQSAIYKFEREDDPKLVWLTEFKKRYKPGEVLRYELDFALSKAFKDLRDEDRFFWHLMRGNEERRKTIDWSVDDERVNFEKMKSLFTKDYLDRCTTGCDDPTPLFVLGMPRSGTTLTEQILASHSDVYGAGELLEMRSILTDESIAGDYPDGWSDPDTAPLKAVGEEFVRRLRRIDPNTRYVTDKMPGNFERIGVIRAAMPNAKIVLCERDPMDNCFSIYRQNFASHMEFAYDLGELGQYYLLYQDLVDHWIDVAGDHILRVRYEDVVEDLEGNARRLLEFCDLPWDDAVLRFHETQRSVRTASYQQVRKPIYKSSVEAWRRYEKELAPLLKVLRPDEA